MTKKWLVWGILAVLSVILMGGMVAGQEDDQDDAAIYGEIATETENGGVEHAEMKTAEFRAKKDGYDDDVFEGFEEMEKKRQQEKIHKEKVDTKEQRKELMKKREEIGRKKQAELRAKYGYKPEIIAVSVIGTYVVLVFVGKSSNDSIATKFLGKYMDFFRGQFALVGDKNCGKFSRESLNTYSLPLSGREDVFGARVYLDLMRRQDFFMNTVGKFLGWRDTVHIDFLLSRSDCFCACIGRNGEKKSLSNRTDIDQLCHDVELKNLPEHFFARADADEAANYLATNALMNAIENDPEIFHSLHVTDQRSIFSTHSHVMRLSLRIPRNGDVDRLKPFIDQIPELISIATGIQLSVTTRAQCLKARAVARANSSDKKPETKEERKQREDAERKKKRLEAMTPEQRERYDKIQKRRENKMHFQVIKK